METAINEALKYLFQEYKKDRNPSASVKAVAKANGVDANELLKELKDQGFVANVIGPPGGQRMHITVRGMLEVDEEFVKDKERDLLESLGKGGRGNLCDIWELNAAQYQMAFSLAKYFEEQGLIKELVHNPQNPSQIMAILTDEGKRQFEMVN